jgi:SAM-dependent methyltransferase
VLDVGCGTATLAVLLAGEGYRVTGLDSSQAMLRHARRKAEAAGVEVDLRQGDAAAPDLDHDVDVVLCRHVLWALPDPAEVVGHWIRLLAPAGRLVLVEGRWATGGGIGPADLRRLVLEHRGEATVVPLPDPALWGRAVDDERYLLVSRR